MINENPGEFEKFVMKAIKQKLNREFNEILEKEMPLFLESIQKKVESKSIVLLANVAVMMREKFDRMGKDLIIKIPFDNF